MSIKISEKHLEDILIEALQDADSCIDLVKRGLYLAYHHNSFIESQFNLKEYGIADIIRINISYKAIEIEVIELKVEEFNIAHVLQLGRYISGIEHILRKNSLNIYNYTIKGILIVSGFNKDNNYVWLDSILNDNISVYRTDYDLHGLHFKKVLGKVGWQKTNASTNINQMINISEALQMYRLAIERFQQYAMPF